MTLAYAVRGAATAQRIRAYMRRTGKTPWGQWLWTREEEQALKTLYPHYDKIQKTLKRRTLVAIRHRAGKLALTKKIHKWTAAEVSKLRRLYPVASRKEILATFPSLSWQQVRNCAQYNGFHRNKKPYKPTGHEILDRILERSFSLGINMADLDEIAGTKKYFQKGCWCGRKSLNAKAIQKAIVALDGKVYVKWDDY